MEKGCQLNNRACTLVEYLTEYLKNKGVQGLLDALVDYSNCCRKRDRFEMVIALFAAITSSVDDYSRG